MGCNCSKKKEQWEVVTPNGKVVFRSASKTTADAVAERYKGSKVRPKDTAQTT